MWVRLIEAKPHELPLLGRDTSLPEAARAYALSVSAFLKGDLEHLRKLTEETKESEVGELVRLRLQLRLRTLSREAIESSKALSGALEGERQFILGMAWEFIGDEAQSLSAFQAAAVLYRESGCARKALRALYNSIAAESRLLPHKNFIADCQAVIEAAREVNDRSFEGMALTMLSREYQVIGLYEKSFAMIERALECLEPERGTIHFFHALLHKAHVLLDLKRLNEIAPLLKEAELSSFAQIHAARELLLAAIDATRIWDLNLEKDLMPTWRNRVPQLAGRQSVISSSERVSTDLEERLLKLVYNGPVEKWDLITRLYPEAASAMTLENRFKNLLGRIRKKYPGKIVCQGGRYSLDKMPHLS